MALAGAGSRGSSYVVSVFFGSIDSVQRTWGDPEPELHIQVSGDAAESGVCRLAEAVDVTPIAYAVGNFSKNLCRRYRLFLPPLTSEGGDLRALRFSGRLPNDGDRRPHASTYLEKIIVREDTGTTPGRRWVFPAYRWMSPDECTGNEFSIGLQPASTVDPSKPGTFTVAIATADRRAAATGELSLFVELVGEHGVAESGRLNLQPRRSILGLPPPSEAAAPVKIPVDAGHDQVDDLLQMQMLAALRIPSATAAPPPAADTATLGESEGEETGVVRYRHHTAHTLPGILTSVPRTGARRVYHFECAVGHDLECPGGALDRR